MSMKRVYAAENSRSANKYVRNYVGVDGRCYKTESGDERELKPRPSVISHGKANERISATDIVRVEAFLGGMGAKESRMMRVTKAQIAVVAKEYDLEKSAGDGRWMADEADVFRRMQEKYETARSYKSYKDILYAVRYGNSRSGAVKVVSAE